MEGWLILLGSGYLFLLPILTVIAWSRSGRHNQEIEVLRKQLAQSDLRADSLEEQLSALQKTVERVKTAPAPAPIPPVTAYSASVQPVAVEQAPVQPASEAAKAAAVETMPASQKNVPVAEPATIMPMELPPLEDDERTVPTPDLSAAEAALQLDVPLEPVQAEAQAPVPLVSPTTVDFELQPLDSASLPAAASAPPPVVSADTGAEPAAAKVTEAVPPAADKDTREPAQRPLPASWSPPRADSAHAGHRPPPPPREPGLVEKAFAAARNWLFGGNTLVRMGMVLVFLGLTFLLRYASEHVVIPLEVRYLFVALTSLVALGLGWRLRQKRPDFALLMQGGAVAVMYLTVFAALRLHDQPLLSMQAGFALLVAVAALAAILAIAQDAMSLALAGSLGGFAAPVLVSTGGGSHVALFSYFALLNSGILGIAWFKAWRPLNLVGFFGTFLIGLAWGLRSYDPALHYASTQGFLILFFLMFVGIGLLFARRVLMNDPSAPDSRDTEAWRTWLAEHGHTVQRYVDGTLLFGTPIIGFGLQYGIVKHLEYGTAFSSLALGAFYLVLARIVFSLNPLRLRLLLEVFLALGVIFTSLAIPMGLDAHWTSAAWAVEAAGLYWIGHRQKRPLARAFALLLQVGATFAFLHEVGPGRDSLLSGSAIGALMVGLSLLCNSLVLRRHVPEEGAVEQWDGGLRVFFNVIGLWSLFLIPPLLWLAEGTAVAWGIVGFLCAGAALRWRIPAWLINALLVQMAAVVAFASTLDRGAETMLVGNVGIAVLLGCIFLANTFLLRTLNARDQEEGGGLAARLFATVGLWLLYLVAPLEWQADNVAAAWSVAGLVTVLLGLRLKAAGWTGNGLLVQLAAGLLFLTHMEHGEGGGVLALGSSGMRGLIVASLIGLAALFSLGLAIRDARAKNDPALVRHFAWMMIFGLGFIALAVLFVLPWQTAAAVWAGSGFVLIWAAMRLRLAPAFWFALFLEAFAGVSFIKNTVETLVDMAQLHAGDAAAFAHSGFWTPVVIALAAFAVAWRLHAYAKSEGQGEDGLDVDGDFLSLLALLWSAGWWAFAWYVELARLAPDLSALGHWFAAAMAASVLLALPIAHKWAWGRLVGLAGLLLPLTLFVALLDYGADRNLLGELGWAAFGLALVAQFGLLRVAPGRLSTAVEKGLHAFNCWVWLAVAALESRYLFLQLGDEGSVWRWLGWTLPLAAWLLWNSRRTAPRLWPAGAYPDLYRFTATLPVVAVLLAWVFLGNVASGGDAAPLPYIPLANPLEIALVLVLFSSWQWLRHLAEQEPGSVPWQGLSVSLGRLVQLGVFLTYTCAVLRGVHHFAGVRYDFAVLAQSMTAQASLSIAWALCALALMIAGHRSARREVWIGGAVLVAVVVAKLFLIELSNRGGLERIVSFIGVGVLLLVVGYFAPLPPRRENADTAAAH